jgi:hypothetical protein
VLAFENADAAALERLLVHDATLEATPLRIWFADRKTCVPFLRNYILGSSGDWRMLAASANGQLAAMAYTRDQRGTTNPTESSCSPSPAQASAGSPPSATWTGYPVRVPAGAFKAPRGLDDDPHRDGLAHTGAHPVPPDQVKYHRCHL